MEFENINGLLLAGVGAGLVVLILLITQGLKPLLDFIADALADLLGRTEAELTSIDTKIATDDSILLDFLNAALVQIAPHVNSADDPAVIVLAKALQRPEFVKVAALLWQATPEEITPAAVAKVLAPIADKLVALTDDIPGNVTLS